MGFAMPNLGLFKRMLLKVLRAAKFSKTIILLRIVVCF